MTETSLVKVEEIKPEVLFFKEGGIDSVLATVRQGVATLTEGADIDTAKGRKAIVSAAYEVARSKTLLDGLGKDVVAEMKAKCKEVDGNRKILRDSLDEIKVEVRKPVTDWEAAEKERIEREAFEVQYDQDWNDAHEHNAMVDKQRDIERREAEVRRKEEEAAAKEEAERQEQERIAREEQIAKEAEERARREAEEKAGAEKERLEQEKREAEERAAQAERDRIAAEERAKIEKEQAVKAEREKLKRESDERETARLAKEKAEREEAERKAADKRHQAAINNAAAQSFRDLGYDDDHAKAIVTVIATGRIKHVTINY